MQAPAAGARGPSEHPAPRMELPTVPGAGARAARPDLTATFYIGLGAAALLLASLSLLLPSTPSYDPWAWLGWGREILHLNLHTTGGPSWKPLPVLFTTVFALFGRAQPDLWLIVARAGTLIGVAMVFRLAYRLTAGLLAAPGAPAPALSRRRAVPPGLAGVIAAASLLNAGSFIVQNALGYSEGLAIALTLVAVDRLLDHRPREALVLGFLAGLDRPELWFAWVPFALWVWRQDPAARRLVLGLAGLTPALWFLPELWGSGDLFRAVTRAHHPLPGTAPFTSCPVCTVFGHEGWSTVMRRVTFPGIGGLLLAAGALWRARGSWRTGRWTPATRSWAWLLALGGGGFLWWLGIAAETQAGFAGDSRYLELGTALVAIAGGVAWGWIAIGTARALVLTARPRALARRLAASDLALPACGLLAAGALVGCPPWIGRNVIDLPDLGHTLAYQAELRADLGRAIASSGGGRALLRCGSVMTEAYQVPMLAWMLGIPVARVEPAPTKLIAPPWPAVILQDRAHPTSALLPAPAQLRAWEDAGAHYTLLARTGTFSVFSTCPPKVRA